MRRRGGGAPTPPTPRDWIILGLGNPDAKYAATRHNAGAAALFVIAQQHGVRLRRSRPLAALAAEVRAGGRKMVLAFPQTYMNRSGESAARLMRRYEIEGHERLVVLHDELDLPPGRVQVKVGGGLAGHHGLASLRDHLGYTGFVRVRIGIGRPPGASAGAKYVLRNAPPEEQKALAEAISVAADAVGCIVCEGAEAAMNRFN